jgi:hypothetical protein
VPYVPENLEGTLEYLEMEHVGRHTAYAIDLTTLDAVELQGGGGAGKTTILNAIIAALTGKDIDDLWTIGEEEAWIETRFAGVQVRRQKVGNRVTLEVRYPDGSKATQPQTVLDLLMGRALLRPLDLYYQKPKDRAQTVLAALPVDPALAREKLQAIVGDQYVIDRSEQVFPTIARAYKVCYDQRTDMNREVKQLASAIETLRQGIPNDFDPQRVPTPPASVGELYQQKQAIDGRNSNRMRYDNAIGEVTQQIAMLQDKLQHMLDERAEMGDMEVTADIDANIANYEQEQQTYQRYATAFGELRARYLEAQAKGDEHTMKARDAEAMDGMVKALAALPGEILSALEMPLEGVSFTEDDILIDGVPFDQRGDSEKLIFCTKIAMMLAPAAFKCVLLDGTERMDAEQRKNLVEYIVGQGFKPILTRVTEGEFTTVPIMLDDQPETLGVTMPTAPAAPEMPDALKGLFG